MHRKSHALTDHVDMIHWITQYAPDSSSDDFIAVPPSEFDDDDDDLDRNEDIDFDWE